MIDRSENNSVRVFLPTQNKRKHDLTTLVSNFLGEHAPRPSQESFSFGVTVNCFALRDQRVFIFTGTTMMLMIRQNAVVVVVVVTVMMMMMTMIMIMIELVALSTLLRPKGMS